MSAKPLQITTPVGRLVGGSLYEPRTTDYEGKPLVVKTGANAGKPRVEYAFGVAIAKTPGVAHWASEAWGAPIWALAHAAFPNGETQRPDFAWKITDGDSTVPNKRSVKPCDREGFKGHWVVWFSGGTAPRIYNANGTQMLLDKDVVKPGHYVQVCGNVTDNKPSQSPGLYWNHSMVAHAGFGPEISFGPDVSQAGFGQGVTLPPGASAVPPATALASTPPAPPGAAVVAAPPPPAAPAKQMTAAAGGATYEAMIAAGWTDATLIANGMMLAPVAASVPPPLPVGSVPAPAAPAPTVVAPPPSPVTPNPDMRAVPAVPGAAVAPPPVAAERMVEGRPLSEWLASGWTEALLIQHGKMPA